jgi:RNA polymerase sigma-70 factor (ECF subfamily)
MTGEHLGEAPTQALVTAAQSGDSAAAEVLLRRYLPVLRAFVRLRSDQVLRAREADSDLVQTACRQALENLDAFEWRNEGSFRNWLFAVALNKIRKHKNLLLAGKRDVRRQIAGTAGDAALRQAYDTILSPTQELQAREGVARIERAIDALPAAYREVVILSRVVGLSAPEIAAQTGQTDGAVRVQLSRALARLALLLEDAR